MLQYSSIQAFTARFVSSMQLTAHSAKQRTGLYSGVSCDCASSTAHDNRPTQADVTPPAPRWSVSQRRSVSSTYQMPTPRRALYRPAQTAYYNNVYKGQLCASVVDPCQPGGVSIFPTPGGLRSGTGSARHPPPGGAVQQLGRSGRRGTIGGYRRISFRAFAR